MNIVDLGKLAQVIAKRPEDEIRAALEAKIEANNLSENQAELLRRAVGRLANQHIDREQIEEGRILKRLGLGGIDYHVHSLLVHAVETSVEQAITDLPDVTPVEIANAIAVGIRMFMNSIDQEKTEAYARQFRD